MKFTHRATLPVPLRSIDLGEWIFNLTDEEYQACAIGHHAMGLIGGAQRLGIINVEVMAGTLIVQHYQTRLAQPDHVTFVSPASEGFLLRLLPFKMSVTWDMQVTALTEETSSLRCTIEVEYPLWVKVAGFLNAATHFVHQHLIEETVGFARELTAKYAQGAGRS